MVRTITVQSSKTYTATFQKSDFIYEYEGEIPQTTVDTGINLLGSDGEKNWTMFVSWDITSENPEKNVTLVQAGGYPNYLCIMGWDSTSAQQWYHQFMSNNVIKGYTWLKDIAKKGKVAYRRDGNKGYVTTDGTTWHDTEVVLPIEDTTMILNARNPEQPFTGTCVIKLAGSSTYDVSTLFNE